MLPFCAENGSTSVRTERPEAVEEQLPKTLAPATARQLKSYLKYNQIIQQWDVKLIVRTELYRNNLGDDFSLTIFNCECILHAHNTSNQNQLKGRKLTFRKKNLILVTENILYR